MAQKNFLYKTSWQMDWVQGLGLDFSALGKIGVGPHATWHVQNPISVLAEGSREAKVAPHL